MKDFEHYLGIANHDIQMANNHNELKSYIASLLYNYDELVEENEELKKQQKEFIKYLKDEIKKLEKVQVSSLEEITAKDYLIALKKEVLSKYKEIIGGNNE